MSIRLRNVLDSGRVARCPRKRTDGAFELVIRETRVRGQAEPRCAGRDRRGPDRVDQNSPLPKPARESNGTFRQTNYPRDDRTPRAHGAWSICSLERLSNDTRHVE